MWMHPGSPKQVIQMVIKLTYAFQMLHYAKLWGIGSEFREFLKQSEHVRYVGVNIASSFEMHSCKRNIKVLGKLNCEETLKRCPPTTLEKRRSSWASSRLLKLCREGKANFLKLIDATKRDFIRRSIVSYKERLRQT